MRRLSRVNTMSKQNLQISAQIDVRIYHVNRISEYRITIAKRNMNLIISFLYV